MVEGPRQCSLVLLYNITVDTCKTIHVDYGREAFFLLFIRFKFKTHTGCYYERNRIYILSSFRSFRSRCCAAVNRQKSNETRLVFEPTFFSFYLLFFFFISHHTPSSRAAFLNTIIAHGPNFFVIGKSSEQKLMDYFHRYSFVIIAVRWPCQIGIIMFKTAPSTVLICPRLVFNIFFVIFNVIILPHNS